jgi:hypothetical protein
MRRVVNPSDSIPSSPLRTPQAASQPSNPGDVTVDVPGSACGEDDALDPEDPMDDVIFGDGGINDQLGAHFTSNEISVLSDEVGIERGRPHWNSIKRFKMRLQKILGRHLSLGEVALLMANTDDIITIEEELILDFMRRFHPKPYAPYNPDLDRFTDEHMELAVLDLTWDTFRGNWKGDHPIDPRVKKRVCVYK